MSFATPKLFKSWLKKHHLTSSGLWVRFYKNASGVKTIIYAEALDEALCYGWIDSQAKTYDAESYLQKFTPRRSKSIWSKRNREHVARLIEEGRMQPVGLKRVEEAKKDGRWDVAYDSPKNMQVPEDLLTELKKYERAQSFFEHLNKANVYAITWRLQTAKKPETRVKRLKIIMDMLKKGETFH